MADLLDAIISICMLVIIVAALFSQLPRIMANFGCEAIVGDTDGDFFKDAGENWTEASYLIQWKQSCNDSNEQNAIVPVLISLVIGVAAIVLVANVIRSRAD